MSLHFSANQYENAFSHDHIQHWELPHFYKERPRRHEGFSQIISNDRGHLLPGVRKSRASPWGPFVGTWDLPKYLPSVPMAIKTGRTDEAADALLRLKTCGDAYTSGKCKYSKLWGEKRIAPRINTANRAVPPLEPITDIDINQSAHPLDMPDPIKSPAQVYLTAPPPEMIKGSPVGRQTTPGGCGELDTNRNANSAMSNRSDRIGTPGSQNRDCEATNMENGRPQSTKYRVVSAEGQCMSPMGQGSPNVNQKGSPCLEPLSSRIGTPKRYSCMDKTTNERPMSHQSQINIPTVNNAENCVHSVERGSPNHLKSTSAVPRTPDRIITPCRTPNINKTDSPFVENPQMRGENPQFCMENPQKRNLNLDGKISPGCNSQLGKFSPSAIKSPHVNFRSASKLSPPRSATGSRAGNETPPKPLRSKTENDLMSCVCKHKPSTVKWQAPAIVM